MQPTDRSKSFVPPAFSPKQPTLDKHRIAVLPLQNISPDTKDEYLADGMTEELITTLSKIGGLKVIARTSVMSYKGGEKKIDEIAKELKVGTILEGSVRKAGDKLRITVQLIDSETSDHLWSENYDRKLDDIFAIQSDIAKQVVESLRVRLLEQEKGRLDVQAPKNVAAYATYLKGRTLLSRRKKDEIIQAKELFESTITQDPSYAPAYSGLADAYLHLGGYFVIPVPVARERARELVSKALELDKGLAEAHATLGRLLMHDYDFVKAEEEFRTAVALNPSYANAHLWYGSCLMDLGKRQSTR